jgi:catechol 2,3-dioxygenase-like lactoylglutathione lyase family enzyme
MTINNALAGIAVRDLNSIAAWYEKVLSRPADSNPMEGLAAWRFPKGGWIQVFQDKDRAGSSSVTFAVTSLDDQLVELKKMGIPVERTITSEITKIVVVADPDGNQIIFAEALSDAIAG